MNRLDRLVGSRSVASTSQLSKRRKSGKNNDLSFGDEQYEEDMRINEQRKQKNIEKFKSESGGGSSDDEEEGGDGVEDDSENDDNNMKEEAENKKEKNKSGESRDKEVVYRAQLKQQGIDLQEEQDEENQEGNGNRYNVRLKALMSLL